MRRCRCQFRFVAVFPDGSHGRCMVCDGYVLDPLAPGGSAQPAGRALTPRTDGVRAPEAGARTLRWGALPAGEGTA